MMNQRLFDGRRNPSAAGILAIVLSGCSSSDSTSSLSVLIEAETTITDGVAAGEGVENIVDGWNAQFDKYVVHIGEVELRSATDADVTASHDGRYVVDLARIGSSAEELFTIDGLEPGRWEFNYHTEPAATGSVRHSSANTADYERMVEDSLTYLIEGSISNDDGVSCPPADLAEPGDAEAESMAEDGTPCYANAEIRFVLPVGQTTEFGMCEIDGVSGVSIPEGGAGSVALTLHGDHMFFSGFPEGDESVIMRLAQWLADSDLDLDGQVTVEELQSIRPSDLREIDNRYSVPGGAPIPINDMWDFVVAQTKTQGHVEGEGECAVDGVAHEHGHEGDDEHGHEGDDEHGHEGEEHEGEEHEGEEHEGEEHEGEEHEGEEHEGEEHEGEEREGEEHGHDDEAAQ